MMEKIKGIHFSEDQQKEYNKSKEEIINRNQRQGILSEQIKNPKEVIDLEKFNNLTKEIKDFANPNKSFIIHDNQTNENRFNVEEPQQALDQDKLHITLNHPKDEDIPEIDLKTSQQTFGNIKKIISESANSAENYLDKELTEEEFKKSNNATTVDDILNSFFKEVEETKLEDNPFPTETTSEEKKQYPVPVEENQYSVPTEGIEEFNQEVKDVRKPKKNMKKTIAALIASLATSLVLLSVGVRMSSRMKSAQTAVATRTETESNSEVPSTEEEIEKVLEGKTPEVVEIVKEPETPVVPEVIELESEQIDSETSTKSTEESELQFNNETEKLEEESIENDNQTEIGAQTVAGQQRETQQETQQTSTGEYMSQENLIDLEDLASPTINADFSKTIEVTDSDALESAFMNSGMQKKIAKDEYLADQEDWVGVKDENIQYWIDNPLRFIEDEKTGAYLMEQQDENGNWIGMGWTNAETAYQYLQNLESYENQTGKGRH